MKVKATFDEEEDRRKESSLRLRGSSFDREKAWVLGFLFGQVDIAGLRQNMLEVRQAEVS